YISSKFRSQLNTSPQGSIDNKLAVLSLRCQSLLFLKMFKMRKHEVKEFQKVLQDYHQKASQPTPMQTEQCGGQGTPSPLSPTPSPAGSVGSVGSQSSGYSSGELAAGRTVGVGVGGGSGVIQQPPAANMGPCVAVPLSVHSSMQKQNQHFNYLLSCLDLWEQADTLVYKGKHKDFFIELDHYCGPLTLHSSLSDLVRYVRIGIQRLKEMCLTFSPTNSEEFHFLNISTPSVGLNFLPRCYCKLDGKQYIRRKRKKNIKLIYVFLSNISRASIISVQELGYWFHLFLTYLYRHLMLLSFSIAV
ncbi:hypothetical protein L9F63_004317, partial [Diploptera punctata]